MKKNKLAVMMMVLCLVCFVSACASKPQTASESQTGAVSQTESEPLTGETSQTEAKLPLRFDEFSNIGITAYMPNEYAHITGAMDYDSQDISSGDGIYLGYLDYIGITGEAYQELIEKLDSEKFYSALIGAQAHPLWHSTEANSHQYGL